MKTTRITLAALLSLLFGCTTVNPDGPDARILTYREFKASMEAPSDASATRTSLSEGRVLWNESGESISIIDTDGNSYTLAQKSVSDDLSSATFSGEVPEADFEYAVYPSVESASYQNGNIVLQIPSTQTAVPESFAGGANTAISKVSSDGSLHFKNVGGIVGFTVNADDITSIRFSASETGGGSLTGPVPVDFSGSLPQPGTSADGNDYVELSGDIQSGTRYWAVVAPGSYEDLQVVFTNSEGRTATFNSGKTLTVERSKAVTVSEFTINEEDWDDYTVPSEFTLVTSVSSLHEGDELLIVYRGGSKALGAIASTGKYRIPEDVTISGNIISSPAAATILTLERGYNSSTWSFKDGSNYLASASSGNSLTNSTSKDEYSSWSISISTSGVATIRAQKGSSTYIKYNTSSPRFSCYSSGQQDVAIFSRAPSGDPGLRVNVTTGNASSITTTSATISGSWSGATATVREAGFHVGTSASDLSSTYQADIDSPGTSGSFSVAIDNLAPDIKYYFCAYVILQDGSDIVEFKGSTSNFTTQEQPDVPPAGSQPGWAELPVMNIEKSGKYMFNSSDDTQYYAWHIIPDLRGPGGKLARNYTVCYSAEHHCPLWVAAPRHSMYIGGISRTDAYTRDQSIPLDIQYSSTSTGGGCNKGHMLGSAERTATLETNYQVFYYTNIAPQLSSGFNTGGGGWNILEDYVDTQVCADTLYEVIGCYFKRYTDSYGVTQTPQTISYGGRSDVHMPTMFYYVLLRTKAGNSGKRVQDCSESELQCVAFVRAHSNSLKGKKVSATEMMSVTDLEEITGVTYFPNVPNAPKNTFKASDWDL